MLSELSLLQGGAAQLHQWSSENVFQVGGTVETDTGRGRALSVFHQF